MVFEVWSNETGNLVASYPSADAAWEALDHASERNGDEYIASLSLVVEDSTGDSAPIATGEDLVRHLGATPA